MSLYTPHLADAEDLVEVLTAHPLNLRLHRTHFGLIIALVLLATYRVI